MPENPGQPKINITIRYSGQIRGVFGMASEQQSVERGLPAQEFILRRAQAAGDKAREFLNGSMEHRSAATLIFINGAQTCWNAPLPLKDGDEILLFSPLAGG